MGATNSTSGFANTNVDDIDEPGVHVRQHEPHEDEPHEDEPHEDEGHDEARRVQDEEGFLL